jgi:hypothetical protein
MFWVVAGIMFEIGEMLIARDLVRELHRRGARRPGYYVGAVGFVAAVPLPGVIWVVGYQPWALALLVMAIPSVIFFLSPDLLIAITGGPLPKHGLARIARAVSARWARWAEAGGLNEADAAWLVRQSRELSRWRTPDTAELVDLYQAKIAAILAQPADREAFAAEAEARNARIDELLAGYWSQD